MMKVAFHKIVSITMAILLLLSTVSWTVDKHLCLGRVIDVALFSKAQDCGMGAAMAMLESEGVENHCCDDDSVTIEGQDDLKLSFNIFDFDQELLLVAYTGYDLYLIEALERRPILNEYYPPPILVKDIQLLDSVFLI